MAITTIAQKSENFDMHSRATFKHSRKCTHKCVRGQDSTTTGPSICGTKEECEEFLRRDRYSDYLMYSVLGIMVFIFYFVCCVWEDHKTKETKV